MSRTWACAMLVLLATLAGCAAPARAPAARTPAGLPLATPATAAAATPVPAPPPAPVFWMTAPIEGDPSPLPGKIPLTGVSLEEGRARLRHPVVLPGARRVGIQAGHWKAEEAPAEFPTLRYQLGASWRGIDEVAVNLDIAERTAALLRGRGFHVDLLAATIPPGYLADAFVSLHVDNNEGGGAAGFKMARGFYRGPFEDTLVELLHDEYARATGFEEDPMITENMTDYYAFAWFRYEHALAPHTPAAIVELGFLSQDAERDLLTERPDVPARAIADGITRFLEAAPRAALFAEDILVPTVPAPLATSTP